MTSPDSLAIAIPSTLLFENEKIKSEITILKIQVSRQLVIIFKIDQTVSENKKVIITDTKNEIVAGNTSLEIKYPDLPTGVIAI
jgi:hypothetical protein